MGGKQSLRFAAAALAAGIAWGYLRHRSDARAPVFALLQGLQWFVAYGGAIALLEIAQAVLEGPAEEADERVERITHFRQQVTERTGTSG
ncbi:MAG: hypothetical protein EXR65_03560 [Dehalococcoidia bacterium]|nr:hypothetical protein [Dehalococcoidia bacterium]